MDPLSLSALIAGILAIVSAIASRIHSSKCSKTGGVDIEFSNTTPVTTMPTPQLSSTAK